MSAVGDGAQYMVAWSNVREHGGISEHRDGQLRVEQHPIWIDTGGALGKHIGVLGECGACGCSNAAGLWAIG